MTEEKVLIINNEKYNDEPGWSKKIEKALNNIKPVNCTIAHHSEISSEFINQVNPSRIILTGRIGHQWVANEISNDYIPKLSIIKNTHVPVLGICAGLQLIAIMFGGNIGKMVDSDNDVLEEGYTKLFTHKEHELLHGLGEHFYCNEFHRDEIKTLPEEFELLASSNMCKVQMISHKTRPIFGVQFHPECYNEEYPDGKQILTNFLEATP